MAAPTPDAFARVTLRTLQSLAPDGATISGTVRYDGKKAGAIIYVLALSLPSPSLLPVAWTALAKPGRFTLHAVPPGRYYLVACYSERRMHKQGDYGGHLPGVPLKGPFQSVLTAILLMSPSHWLMDKNGKVGLVLDDNRNNIGTERDVRPLCILKSSDAGKTLAHMKEKGVEICFVQYHEEQVFLFTFRDTEGNVLMIMQEH